MQTDEIEKTFSDAFQTSPIISRKCTSALNEMQLQKCQSKLPKKTLDTLFARSLSGFTTKDEYLKKLLYVVIESNAKDCESFVAINTLAQDYQKTKMKLSCARALFSVLPPQMQKDYENIVFHLINNFSSALPIAILYDQVVKYGTKSAQKTTNCVFGDAIFFEEKKSFEKNETQRLFENFLATKNDRRLLFLMETRFSTLPKSAILTVLRSSSAMIFSEAFRQISKMREIDARKFVAPAVANCRNFLRSNDIVVKFAVLRTLQALSMQFPLECAAANPELEFLLNDETISPFVTTILLRTANENTVESVFSKINIKNFSNSAKKALFETLIELKVKKNSPFNFVPIFETVLREDSKEMKIFVVEKISHVIKFGMKNEFLKMLCDAMEDNEEGVVAAILGFFSKHVGFCEDEVKTVEKILIHIVNRIVLDSVNIKIKGLETLAMILQRQNVKSGDFYEILKKYAKKDDEIFYEMGNFLLNNKIEEFKVVEKEGSKILKENKEIKVSEDDSDVQIGIKKTVYSDKVLICVNLSVVEKMIIKNGVLFVDVFCCDNKKEGDVEKKEDKKVVVVESEDEWDDFKEEIKNMSISEDNKKSINFEDVNESEENVLDFSRKQKFSLKFDLVETKEENFVFTVLVDRGYFDFSKKILVACKSSYALCQSGDLSEFETDSMVCAPLSISFIDYFVPSDNFESSEKYAPFLSFSIDSTIEKCMERIVNLLNFKVVDYDADNGSATLFGRCGDVVVKVVIDMYYEEKYLEVGIVVYGDNKDVCDGIVRLFDRTGMISVGEEY